MTLKELRNQAELKQETVANELDICQPAVSKWEKGETSPSRKYRKRLADMYGCTLEDLSRAIEEGGN